MQTCCISLPSLPSLPLQSTKTSSFSNPLFPTKTSKISYPIKPQVIQTSTSISIAAAAAASDTPEVDYSSMASSVFPAEACETVGGVACDVEMFPETKLREEPKAKAAPTSETVDREYLEYDSPKTVFIAEACDDLGGEFCEPAYQNQSGVN